MSKHVLSCLYLESAVRKGCVPLPVLPVAASSLCCSWGTDIPVIRRPHEGLQFSMFAHVPVCERA